MSVFDQIANLGSDFRPVDSYARGQKLWQQNALLRTKQQQAAQEAEQKNALLQTRNQLAVADPSGREPIINNMFALDPAQAAAAKKFYGVGGGGVDGDNGGLYGNVIWAMDPQTQSLVAFQPRKTGQPQRMDFGGAEPVRPLVYGDTGAELIGREAFTGAIKTRTPKQLPIGDRPSIIREQEQARAEGRGAGGLVASQEEKFTNAQEVLDLAKMAEPHLRVATGSLAGDVRDKVTGAFGISTEGAQAISALQPIAGSILMKMPRNPGPASDMDVKIMNQMAGKLDDPHTPPPQKIAAFNTIVTLAQRIIDRENRKPAQKPKTAKDLPGYREPPKKQPTTPAASGVKFLGFE
jgi:hypothetical protein